jgi:hypothetical protein
VSNVAQLLFEKWTTFSIPHSETLSQTMNKKSNIKAIANCWQSCHTAQFLMCETLLRSFVEIGHLFQSHSDTLSLNNEQKIQI